MRYRCVMLLLALLLWALPAAAETPAPTETPLPELAALAEAYADEMEAALAEDSGFYGVYVCDQYGDPVPGVYVNFCTDTTCQPVPTGEDGAIGYVAAPFDYHLQILKAPEGYSFDGTLELYTGEASGWLEIRIARDL